MGMFTGSDLIPQLYWLFYCLKGLSCVHTQPYILQLELFMICQFKLMMSILLAGHAVSVAQVSLDTMFVCLKKTTQQCCEVIGLLVLIVVDHQSDECIRTCDITALSDVFFETNKYKNIVRPRCPNGRNTLIKLRTPNR